MQLSTGGPVVEALLTKARDKEIQKHAEPEKEENLSWFARAYRSKPEL